MSSSLFQLSAPHPFLFRVSVLEIILSHNSVHFASRVQDGNFQGYYYISHPPMPFKCFNVGQITSSCRTALTSSICELLSVCCLAVCRIFGDEKCVFSVHFQFFAFLTQPAMFRTLKAYVNELLMVENVSLYAMSTVPFIFSNSVV